MLEAVGIQTTRSVEISKNNSINKICGEVEKTGKQFLEKNHTFVNHYNDWRVARDGADISFSKKEDKQHLKIHYEKPKEDNKSERKMNGLDFVLSDGKTTISLQKNDGESWKIVREKDGHRIEGGNILRKDEERELSNFLYKFKRDRILNNIVDTIRKDKIFKYVLPVTTAVVGIATGGFQPSATQISQESWQAAFLGPTPISQPIANTGNRKERNIQQADPQEIPQNRIHFENEYAQIFKAEREATLAGEEGNVPKIGILGAMQEIELVTNFYDSSLTHKDGQTLELQIRKYLRSLNINGLYNYRQYDSVGKPGKALVGDLEKALIDIRNNPYSQKSVYGLLDALHKFNTGRPMVTPESIMNQSGFLGSSDNFSGQELWDAYWKSPEVFDDGTIKATSVIFDTTSIGDLVVSQDLVGRVMSINGDKITVWVFDQNKGGAKLVTFSADDFPNPALGFR